MRWKEIATKLDTLVDELSAVVSDTDSNRRSRTAPDPEKAADKWVRRYVRSRQVPLPSNQVLHELLARASYAATFARMAPRQELEIPTPRAVEIVEILMIDLWYGCFKEKWNQGAVVDEVAFAA